MEEDLTYVTPMFNRTSAPVYEKPEDLGVVYDQVNLGHENSLAAEPVEQKAEARLHPQLCALAAVLGVVCVVLASVLITVTSRFSTVTSGQEGEIQRLTGQMLLLRTETTHLEREVEELSSDRDRLNWTLGVILQYDVFPVNLHCPRKVCKPCQDGWKQFDSKCYLFDESIYYSSWRTMDGSWRKCKELEADLVEIESLEEQEFINNHTKKYNDDDHGYWIGLKNQNKDNAWMWISGSNTTVEYWQTKPPDYQVYCALTLPNRDPLASWKKTACNMKNRWICERKALIRND